MIDNEIIKALECCNKSDNGKGCFECPYRQYCPDCLRRRNEDTIDLINRRKAEIERLKDILYDADGVNLVNYWHQQCKVAENGCRNFEEENENLKAEIERLTGARNADPMDFCGVLCRYTEELINKAKAEAVKEFAERLKKCSQWLPLIAMPDPFVTVSDIDNLVKEMVGEG